MTEPLTITTTRRDDHQMDMQIQWGPERTEQALQQAYKLVIKKARIPGFRPGKAPYATVLRLFGRKALLREVMDDLGEKTIREALDQTPIEVYGQVNLVGGELDPPTFNLVIPLRPTVDLGDYRSIRLVAPQVNVSEAEVDAILEAERSRRSGWEDTDRPAAIGDMVILDITGTVGDTLIMDNHDWELTLKEEAGWLPGFDAAFVGLSADEEETDFSLIYPEDSSSRFKGQQADFHAVVKAVRARVEPELNDEFARSLGDFESLADLRARVLTRFTEQRTTEAEEMLNTAAIERLIEQATIAYPPPAVNDIVDEIVHNLEDGVKERGQKLEDFLRLQGMTLEKYREQARPIAEHQLKVRLVLIELAQQEGITVPDEEAQAEADRLTAAAAESDHTDALQGIFKSDSGQVRRQYDPLTSKTLARLRAIVTGQAPELPAAEAPAAEAPALEVAPPAEALAVAIEPGATAESPAEMPATDTAAVLEPLAAEAVPVVEQIE